MAFNIPEMRRRAEAGDCPSQCMLGLCYLYGVDVEVSYEEALRFLSAAAEQRASRAVLNLGRMYAQGLGVQQDVTEAIKRFESVAKPSDSSDAFAARIELGRIFSQGLGIPIDKNLARKWYSAAVEIATESDDLDEVSEAREYLGRLGAS